MSLQGAGQAFPRAQYAVKGKTAYDQTWIDKTIEAEVKGFGFKRPLKRPTSLDQQTVTVTPAKPALLAPTEPAVVSVVPKKLHWWQRKRHEP